MPCDSSYDNINKELYAPNPTTPPMSSESEQPSDAHANPDAEIARLKRRLAASQDEIKELTQGKTKKPPCADFYFYLPCILTYMQDNRHNGPRHSKTGVSI